MNTRSIPPVGLACALGATCLWGLSFVIPVMLPGVAAFDISIGRYLIYGVLGAVLFARQRRYGVRLTRSDMWFALAVAVTGYWGCYTVLVLAIEAAGPALPTMVMGLTPVTVAVVGNMRRREVPFSRLTGPLVCIGAGLGLANLARFGFDLSAAGGTGFWPGLAWSLLALAMMTAFLVGNLLFLKARPRITPAAWANAIGLAVLGLSLLALLVRPLLFPTGLAQAPGPAPWRFAAGCAVLGLGSSWLGAVLWNRANALLPATVAGQCIVFWPISGLVFAYLVQSRLPGPAEAAGVALVFAGIVWGLRVFAPGR